MSTECEVHVGDNATVFEGKLLAGSTSYDPTEAGIRQLIFQTQNGLFIRDAEVTVKQILNEEGAVISTDWYLVYRMRPGTEDDKFHRKPGVHYFQGYVEFSSGQKFHTSIACYEVEVNLA